MKILLGRRGSGKTFRVINDIKKKIMDQPLGDPIIMIAPKQSTFMLEEALAEDSRIKGSMRASIYGFDRLSWRIMSEEGGLSEEMISSSGIEMMTYMLLKSMQHELKLFSTSARYFGFSQKLTAAIKDFKKYDVTPAALLETAEMMPVRTQHKLHDIGIIYQALEQQLADLYIQSEDILNFLYQRIPASRTIKLADIYIDGFHNFTSLEYQVIEQLARFAKSLTITLTVDTAKDNETFRKTNETYRLLTETLHKAGRFEVERLKDTARFKNHALDRLEAQFDAMLPSPSSPAGITLNEAENTRMEVEAIVRQIHQSARLGQYRYADIAVLYRDSSYINLFKNYFDRYQIPYFTDSKEPMIHHPVIEMIRSLLDFTLQPWQTEHLFRLLKTGMLSRQFNMDNDLYLIDMLENTVIERGLSFNRWLEDERFFFDDRKPYNRADWERMNIFRKYIAEQLLTFTTRFKEASTARIFAQQLFEFLVQMKIPDYLMAERDRLVKVGLNQQALFSEQVYEKLIGLLDEFVDMLEGRPLDFATMKEMFDVGLMSLEFSSIPQKMDEVQLLNMDLARVENIPCVYICGFNEGILPRPNKDNGLITDQDKALLESHSQMMLAPSSAALTMDESFVAYQALTNATDELHIYYSLMGELGDARQPSSYIGQLKAIFPDLLTTSLSAVKQPEQLIETIEAGIPHIVEHMDEPAYQPVIKALANDPQFSSIIHIKGYINQSEQLSEELAMQLYGEEIKASVSRFESYNNCPFKHFAEHGLKLTIRQPFEFQNFELGNIFHHALKVISEEVKDTLLTLDKDALRQYVELTLKNMLPDVQYQVLYSKAYYQYMIQRITAILTETLGGVQFHQSNSHFKMARFEQSFNAEPHGSQFSAQKLFTEKGIPISIRGQIDRIDLLETEDSAYISIVDYKSSSHKLDLREVYYGKQMQMMTYMDVALQNGSRLSAKETIPAALLYFHVKEPFIKYSSRDAIENHHLKMLEDYKLEGYVLNDIAVVSKMDTALEAGTSSKAIPVALTKDSSFNKRSSSVLERKEIEQLIAINRSNFVRTADQIMAGHTNVAPLEYKNQLPCQFCAFKSTCHIDPLLNSNDVRHVDEKLDVKAILKGETDETQA